VIRGFLYSWLAYWAVVLLLPVHSIYPNVSAAFLLQMVFTMLVLLGYVLASPGLREIVMPLPSEGEMYFTRRLVKLSFWMSLAGFLMLLFDKIYIQHIDYTHGLAIAREQWRELGEEREGRASSIWSILGYALGSAYYVSVVLVITQATVLSARERLRAIGAALLFALANSVITGGRSNFLLLAIVSLAALSARRGLRIRDIFSTRGQRRFLIGGAVLSATYIVFIFVGRARSGDQVVYEYVANYLPWMGVAFDHWYVVSVSQGWIGTVGHMTVLTLGYLTHSFATTAAIMDAPHEDKVIIFRNFAEILFKFGLISRPDMEWFLVGKFPSLPGALWHQFGAVGFAIGSLLLGVVASWTSMWAAGSPQRLLPLGVYVLVGANLFLTPYVCAADLLSFPSVVVAVVVLAALSRLTLRTVSVAGVQPATARTADALVDDGSSPTLPGQAR
jgi:hypothetical protein